MSQESNLRFVPVWLSAIFWFLLCIGPPQIEAQAPCLGQGQICNQGVKCCVGLICLGLEGPNGPYRCRPTTAPPTPPIPPPPTRDCAQNNQACGFGQPQRPCCSSAQCVEIPYSGGYFGCQPNHP